MTLAEVLRDGKKQLEDAGVPEAELNAWYLIQGFGGSMQGFLIGIFLREEYRGKGIGKALLARMRRGEESMSVAVYQKNIRGVRFYMREGFKVQSERTEESTGEKEFLLEWKK